MGSWLLCCSYMDKGELPKEAYKKLKQIGVELLHAILVYARTWCNRTSEYLELTWILGVQCIARSSVMIRRFFSVYLWAHYQCVLRQMQLIQIRAKESARGHQSQTEECRCRSNKSLKELIKLGTN